MARGSPCTAALAPEWAKLRWLRSTGSRKQSFRFPAQARFAAMWTHEVMVARFQLNGPDICCLGLFPSMEALDDCEALKNEDLIKIFEMYGWRSAPAAIKKTSHGVRLRVASSPPLQKQPKRGDRGCRAAGVGLVRALRIGPSPRRFTRAPGGLVGGLESGAAAAALVFWPLGCTRVLCGTATAKGPQRRPAALCVGNLGAGPCHRLGAASSRGAPGMPFRPFAPPLC